MDDLNAIKSQALQQLELLQNDITALACLSWLFASANGVSHGDLHDLCYLIDPITERQSAVMQRLRDLLGQGGSHVD